MGVVPILATHSYECTCGRRFVVVPGEWLAIWTALLSIVALFGLLSGSVPAALVVGALALPVGLATLRVRRNPVVR